MDLNRSFLRYFVQIMHLEPLPRPKREGEFCQNEDRPTFTTPLKVPMGEFPKSIAEILRRSYAKAVKWTRASVVQRFSWRGSDAHCFSVCSIEIQLCRRRGAIISSGFISAPQYPVTSLRISSAVITCTLGEQTQWTIASQD